MRFPFFIAIFICYFLAICLSSRVTITIKEIKDQVDGTVWSSCGRCRTIKLGNNGKTYIGRALVLELAKAEMTNITVWLDGISMPVDWSKVTSLDLKCSKVTVTIEGIEDQINAKLSSLARSSFFTHNAGHGGTLVLNAYANREMITMEVQNDDG